MLIQITGGAIYDPANGKAGAVEDLWIRDGKVIARPEQRDVVPDQVYDVRGCVVMPGGVDMHCHIVGSKVTAARKLLSHLHRDGAEVRGPGGVSVGRRGPVPNTFATGYLYAGLGYTTAVDAAIPPLAARQAHLEFHDTPVLDKAMLLLLGNHRYVLERLEAGDAESLKTFVPWILRAGYGAGMKVVNPGGGHVWQTSRGSLHDLDETIPGMRISPRTILRELAAVNDHLKLPHAAHLHCQNLGLPGNWRTTLASMQALEGHRGHLTHIQFHSYSGEANDQGTFASAVQPLVEYVNQHPNITVDVGQVMFGDTVSMTADGAVGAYLANVTGRKWVNHETELEAGCGIVPITYRDKSFVHALQWAIGLEWYLLMNDPWRIAMSTDHPNGAAFFAYPEIIALLMDRGRREDVLSRLPEAVRQKSSLADLTREYTLNEIAIITRAAPVRMLGLTTKGHLGPGADADITVYADRADRQAMFESPKLVFKSGQLVVRDTEIVASPQGQTWFSHRDLDEGREKEIAAWLDQNSSVGAKELMMNAGEFENIPKAIQAFQPA